VATSPGDLPAPAAAEDVLPPISASQRFWLGSGITALGMIAVLLGAGQAPAAVRAPAVLLAGLLLPGYPLVARLRLDLPTLIAADVCVSLALDGALALLTVELHAFNPGVASLVLACFGVGGTFATLTAIRSDDAPDGPPDT